MNNDHQSHPEYNSYNWDASTSYSEVPSLTQTYSNTGATTTNLDTEDAFTDTGTEGRLSPEPSIYSLTSSLRDQSFRHVHGRCLNAHSDVYSLPADEEEAQRLYKQHSLFYYLGRNDNYYGMWETVREVMAPTHERRRAALDLGCGPGNWTIQCAIDFPHAEVLGVDLAPTSAVVPPQNCRFEIDDLNLGLEHFFGDTFDFVHARLLNSGVKDYAGLVDQVSRSVRPGGLVIFAEVDFRVWSEDKRLLLPPNFYTPLPSRARPSLANAASIKSGGSGSSNSGGRAQVQTKITDWAVPTFFAAMSKCVRAKGGNIDAAALLKTWMREHPNYEDVQTRDLWAPLGVWTPTILDEWTAHPNFRICQELAKENLISLAKGARPLLYDWFSEQEVAELEGNAVREITEDGKPMYIRVQVTSARKKRVNA
ncbi:methyltransferase domain protein [Ceratobasidium sp. AG-Ba]|nr:methyltransferase domain protein [Ceratobasidium sp. AG-Ba]